MSNYNRDNFKDGKTTKVSSFSQKHQRGVAFSGSSELPHGIESDRFLLAYKEQIARYLPAVNYRIPSEFCQFGSAESYYRDSFDRILETYPYDGSKSEKIEWSLSSSVVDLYILEHEYPKSTGHIDFGKDHVVTGTRSSGKLYSQSPSPKYIKFFGGPHKGTIYNQSKNRESNLKIDGEKGNTVEFWLKKDEGTWRAARNREVVLDVFSKFDDFSEYGRLLIELETPLNDTHSPIKLTHTSGAIGTTATGLNAGIRLGDSSVTMDTVADGQWHHYAITMKTVDTSTVYKLYIDGTLNYTTTESWKIGPITHFINGAIGASGGGASPAAGEGTLQASIDEFRYWKEARTEKQIGENWYRPVHGGTDGDHSNANLGLYYKFNEGITDSTTLDKVVLDYSGRINNGTIVNYDSTLRSLDSAINLSLNLPVNEKDYTEKGDPIVVDGNNLIEVKKSEFLKIGKEYDAINNNSLLNSVPQFIRDQDEEFFPELTQIIASTLDDIFLKIKHLPKLKDYNYEDFFTAGAKSKNLSVNNFFLGCDDTEESKIPGAKTKPWTRNTLEHFGFLTPEIFQEATVQEFFNEANEDITFEQKLSEIRNIILSNIHKNLVYIYSAKGTEKSFRNMLRCFGVDTELIKFNVYVENEEREVLNDVSFETVKQKSADFSNPLNSAATLYSSASSDADSRGYVTGSNFEAAYTLETNVILPASTLDADITKGSLFGIKTVDDSLNLSEHQASGSFEVFAIRPNSKERDVYFLLTSSYHMFQEVTSSTFTNAYNNEHWNISVKVSRNSDIEGSLLAAGGSEPYSVELTGFNYDLDLMQNSFTVSSSVTKANFDKFNSANKFVYAGAERAEISGSLLNRSNVRCLGLSFWLDKLTEEELKLHAQNSSYFGRKNPTEISKYNSGQNILAGDTSIFRWQFENLSSSSGAGTMIIDDLTSGSLSRAQSINGGSIVGYKHPALGFNFGETTDAIEQEFMPFVKVTPIGNRFSSNDVNIINTEIQKFTADSRPSSKKFTFEKSMYQSISERMLDFFSGIVGFNTLIGSTVNKYRQEYKALKVLRERFFSKVENTIDLDQFIEYYRWMDDSISQALAQLLPASANISDNLRNTVESHMLERNKYQHPAPTLEFKLNEDTHSIFGINELSYNWKLGHAPLPTSSLIAQDVCLWENQREEVSADRIKIKEAAITEVSGSTYARKALVKPYKFGVTTSNVQDRDLAKDFYKSLSEGRSIEIRASEILDKKKECTTAPDAKSKYEVSARIDGDVFSAKDIMPFSFMSESNSLLRFSSSTGISTFDKAGLKLSNIENRSILQGPFPNQHEGRMDHRDVDIGKTLDRPEAYHISMSQNALTMSVVDTHRPRSVFTKGMGISTPYTIRNIKTSTDSRFIGNYQKDYEIVQIHGKASNNSDIAEGTFRVNYLPSDHIQGMSDFTRPTGSGNDHVISSRFSSPGGFETAGAFARDPESGEFSIYNAVNYRNLLIRETKNALDAEYSEQFGYRSGSSTVGSTHKTNRNPTRFITEESQDLQFDNFFKQTHIPSNDFGYSWITSSVDEGVYTFLKKNGNFGHQGNFYPGYHLLNDSSSALYYDDGGTNNPYVRFDDDSSWTLASQDQRSNLYVANFAGSTLGEVIVADNNAFSFVASSSATNETVIDFHPASFTFGANEHSSYQGQLTLANSGTIITDLSNNSYPPDMYTYQMAAYYDTDTDYISAADTNDTKFVFTTGSDSTIFNAQYVQFPGGDRSDTGQYPTTFTSDPAEHYPFLWASDIDELSFVNAGNTAEVSFTIAFWMRKHVKSSANDPGILGKWGTSSEYFLKQDNRNLSFQIRDGLGSGVVTSYNASNILSDNTNVWEHIAITYDVTGNQVKYYKNGDLFSTISRNADYVSGAKRMSNSTNKFFVGLVTHNSNFPFDGDLSNIAIFKHDGDMTAKRSNTVLSATDVKMLYNDGMVFDYTQHSKASDMVCWWPMAIDRGNQDADTLPNSGSASAALQDGREYNGSVVSIGLNRSPFFQGFSKYVFSHLSASTSTVDAGFHPYVTDGVLDGRDFEDQAFTIAFWMKKASKTQTKTILAKRRWFEVYQEQRNIVLRLINSDYDHNTIHGYPPAADEGAYAQFKAGTSFLSDNTTDWEHIVIHYYYKPSALRQEVKFWRNGVSTGLAHTNVTGAGTYKHMKTVFDGAPLVIGQQIAGSNAAWKGHLSNVALWRHDTHLLTMNDSTVKPIYNNGRAFDLRRLDYYSRPRELVGYFKLNSIPSTQRPGSFDALDYINNVASTVNGVTGMTDVSPGLHYQHVEDRHIFVSAWVRFDTLTGQQVLFSKNEHNNENDHFHKEYELRKDANNKLVLELFDQTPLSTPTTREGYARLSFTGSTIAAANTWYHLSVIYNPGARQLENHGGSGFVNAGGYNNRATFYINKVASSAIAPTQNTLDYVSMVDTPAELRFGHRKNIGSYVSGFDGKMAHVFVATGSADIPFTAADVAEAYNDGFAWNLQNHSKFASASFYYKFTNNNYDKGSVPKDVTAFPTVDRTVGGNVSGDIATRTDTSNPRLQFKNLRDVNFAISFWMQAQKPRSGSEVIISKFAGGTLAAPTGAPEFALVRNNRNLDLYVFDLSGLYGKGLVQRMASATNILSTNANEWEHITVVRDKDNDKVIFYKNANRGGVHAGSKVEVNFAPSVSSPNYEEMENTATNVTIGNLFEGDSSARFFGRLSNLLIFKQTISQTALSDGDVTDLYNNGKVFDYNLHSKASQIAAWYKLEDEAFAKDPAATTALEQISSLTGSYKGAGATVVPDNLGTALTAESFQDKSFTITFRMKTANTAKQYFIGKVPSSGAIEYTGFIEANKIVVKFNENISGGSKTFTANLIDITLCNDEWRHIAIVYNAAADRMTFYVDGTVNVSDVADSEGNASYSSMTDQASQLYIGNAYLSGYNSFSGSLADFAIYKHDGVDGRSSSPFTATEVSSSYNHGYRTDLNLHSKVDDLVGYWKLGGHLDSATNTGLNNYSANRALAVYDSVIRLVSLTGPRSEDPFTVNIPTTAGGDGQDITFKMTASLPPSAGTGRVNGTLPARTVEVKIPTSGTATENRQEIAQRVLDAINGTGADDDSKFVVSADLIDGVSGMTATTTAVAGFLDITSTSRDVSATEFVFANISTGSHVQTDNSVTLQRSDLSSTGTQHTLMQSPMGLTPDIQVREHSSKAISFLERSEQDPNLGFVPSNRVFASHITQSENTVSHDHSSFAGSSDLDAIKNHNSLILSRQGPYGWPTWKQLRGSEHPVSKHLRSNSLVSIVFDEDISSASSRTGYRYDPHSDGFISVDTKQTETRQIQNFQEPAALQSYSPVIVNFYDTGIFPENQFQGLLRHKLFQAAVSDFNVDNYNPLNLSFDFKDRQPDQENLWSFNATPAEFAEQKTSLSFGMVKTSYQNDLVKFSNQSLKLKLKLNTETKHHANIFIKDLVSNYNSPLMVSFKQDIYPKNQNMFLDATRGRTLFDHPWNKTRSNRTIVLTGSLNLTVPPSQEGYYVYPKLEATTEKPTRTLNSMGIDVVGHSSEFSEKVNETKSNITASVWPLDARTNFSTAVADGLGNYFVNLSPPLRGKLGEGELQNDYSIYHGGLNTMFGIAPPAMVYSRRVIQNISFGDVSSSLTGDAKWTAASQLGSYPYKDSYNQDMHEIRAIAKEYSLVSEYKIGDHVEAVVTGSGNFLDIPLSNALFSLTGSVADQISGGVVETYSLSDMMECFGLTVTHNEDDIEPIKITLRCDAAIKFVPYEGFYPAERVIQMGRLFSNGYLSHLGFESQTSATSFGTNNTAAFEAKKRANLQQAIKPLFAPGILFNSIKSGVAVDYPIFTRNEGKLAEQYHVSSNPYGLLNSPAPPMSGSGPYVNAGHVPSNATHRTNANTRTVGITGSFIHMSKDTGIPRISGSVSSRVTFEQLLDPTKLEKAEIHDNEPHSSASLIFGNHMWESVLERPFKFGQLDVDRTFELLGGNIKVNGDLETTMKPFSMAMNNFCAETTDLFVQDGLATFEASAPSTAEYQKDKVYRMRLNFENRGTMMYDRHSAFGPPVDEGGIQNFLSASTVKINTPAYAATTRIKQSFPQSFSWPISGIGTLLDTPGFDIVTNVGTQTNFAKTLRLRFFNGTARAVIGASDPVSDDPTFTNDASSETKTLFMNISDATKNAIDHVEDALALALTKSPQLQINVTTDGGLSGVTLTISQLIPGVAGNTTLSEVGTSNVSVWGNILEAESAGYTTDGTIPKFVGGSDAVSQGTNITTLDTIQVKESHGYLPYVPPFLDPGTTPFVEFAFKPSETRTYSLEEVLETIEITSSNNITSTRAANLPGGNGGPNLINAMTLGASIDYKAFSIYQEDVDSLDSDNQATAKRWVIQTKWETPVLDFSDSKAEVTKINRSSKNILTEETSTSFWKERDMTDYYRVDNMPRADLMHEYLTSSRGMWHQAGTIPTGESGYVMTITDVATSEDPGGRPESLGKKVKLLSDTPNAIRTAPVGKVKEQNSLKDISEAVIAIPMYTRADEAGLKFLDVRQDMIEEARKLNANLESSRISSEGRQDPRYMSYYNDPGSTPVESVAYQLRMLDKYVFPPVFDVNRFSGENIRLPFMFIFQFNAKFNREDLTNIWQNVMPTSRDSGATGRFSYGLSDNGNTRKDTKYVSMFLDDIFNYPFESSKVEDFINEDTQWLIFKAKMRAKSSVPQLKEDSLPEVRNEGLTLKETSFSVDREALSTRNAQGTYNWPYDYFSIVELIKVGAKADFKKREN